MIIYLSTDFNESILVSGKKSNKSRSFFCIYSLTDIFMFDIFGWLETIAN